MFHFKKCFSLVGSGPPPPLSGPTTRKIHFFFEWVFPMNTWKSIVKILFFLNFDIKTEKINGAFIFVIFTFNMFYSFNLELNFCYITCLWIQISFHSSFINGFYCNSIAHKSIFVPIELKFTKCSISKNVLHSSVRKTKKNINNFKAVNPLIMSC